MWKPGFQATLAAMETTLGVILLAALLLGLGSLAEIRSRRVSQRLHQREALRSAYDAGYLAGLEKFAWFDHGKLWVGKSGYGLATLEGASRDYRRGRVESR